MSVPSSDTKIIQTLSAWALVLLLIFLTPRPGNEVLQVVWGTCGGIAAELGSIAAGTGIWAAVRRPSWSVVISAATAVLIAVAAWMRWYATGPP